MAGCKNQLIMKYHGKFLVSNIYHIEFFMNLYKKIYHCKHFGWDSFPIKKYKQQPAHIRLQLNSGKT